MKKWFTLAWQQELPIFSERFRWLANIAMIAGTIGFTVFFVQMWHHMVYLGPGLGEQASMVAINELVIKRLQNNDLLTGLLLAALLTGILLFRAWVIAWSYFGYEKKFGEKFPQQLFWLFTGLNALAALLIPVVLFLLGLMLLALGFDFQQGWQFMETVSSQTLAWVDTNIPTLVTLPSAVAVVLIFFIAGFFHYWLHRLGHEFRALWLLFHRHHHMTPKLMQFCAGPVFFSFPLFIIFLLPYTFIFGSITKLFHAEPLYLEIFILNCLFMIPEIYGHSDVFYDQGKKSRWVKAMSFIFGNGIYHYMHHSANPEDCTVRFGRNKGLNRKVNMVNMGGGLFFFWDIVFGTFTGVREEKPSVGLMGQPELHKNPLRLALSGFVQIIYELVHNKGFKTRFKILFGPSDYTPPVSKDFAIQNKLGQ